MITQQCQDITSQRGANGRFWQDESDVCTNYNVSQKRPLLFFELLRAKSTDFIFFCIQHSEET